MRRCQLRYKRGRQHVHSPDLDYDAKRAYITALQTQCRTQPQRYALLYQDELTYYRRASVGYDYAPSGSDKPHAQQGVSRNKHRRIAACLDARTGQLLWWQRDKFDRHTFIRYLDAVQQAYPAAERIYIVMDNWPVHHHPDVSQWVAASRIELVWLPTYASWLNPAEKVWRKLKQELLHQHHYGEDWTGLTAAVERWLEQTATQPTSLLHYVGLLPYLFVKVHNAALGLLQERQAVEPALPACVEGTFALI